MARVRVTVRLSEDVDARLRVVAAIEGKRIGKAAEDLLDKALPCSADLAARISGQGAQRQESVSAGQEAS